MVPEWRSVIAISLNVGGGRSVYVHAKTLQTQRGRTHGAGCARS